MKILIVDDEPDLRQIAALTLQTVGQMEVIEAENGRIGFEYAKEQKPDAIILDVMMPEMDGPTTIQKLKQDPETASIPVIFLTAKAQKDELEHLARLGAKAIMTKPFEPMSFPQEVLQNLGLGS